MILNNLPTEHEYAGAIESRNEFFQIFLVARLSISSNIAIPDWEKRGRREERKKRGAWKTLGERTDGRIGGGQLFALYGNERSTDDV